MNIEAIVNERFTALKLTQAIEKRQNEYGLLNSMGLFIEQGIADRQVKIESKNSALSIIPTSPIGTPAPADDLPDGRDVRILPTFRHAKKYTIYAEELQGVRAFGSDDEMENVDTKVLEKLDLCQREHRQTKEFLRWQALKGNVYDPDGTRLLFNTYDVMGETQKTVEWDMDGVAGTNGIQDGTDELLDYFEENALGEMITGVVKFCSPGYMTAMQKNADFKEAYKYFSGQPNPNRETLRRPFEFKDVIYVRHMGKCSFKKADGTVVTHKFIPDNEAIAVPLGTTEAFRTFFGPAEFMETVNTIGQEIYVKPKVMDLDMGVELHSFSHALNLATKPRLVVKCTLK
jgi:hypothetical protein